MATERSTFATARETARRADAEGKLACAQLLDAYSGFFRDIAGRVFSDKVPEDLRDVKLRTLFQTSDMGFIAGADGIFVLFHAKRALRGPRQGENEIILRRGSVTVRSPGNNSGLRLSFTAQDIELWEIVNNRLGDEFFKVKDRPFKVLSTAVFLDWVQSVSIQKGFWQVNASHGQS